MRDRDVKQLPKMSSNRKSPYLYQRNQPSLDFKTLNPQSSPINFYGTAPKQVQYLSSTQALLQSMNQRKVASNIGRCIAPGFQPPPPAISELSYQMDANLQRATTPQGTSSMGVVVNNRTIRRDIMTASVMSRQRKEGPTTNTAVIISIDTSKNPFMSGRVGARKAGLPPRNRFEKEATPMNNSKSALQLQPDAYATLDVSRNQRVIRLRAKLEAAVLEREQQALQDQRIMHSSHSNRTVTTLALDPSSSTFKLLSTKNLHKLQEKEKVLLEPRFPYSPHSDADKIKSLRREREKMNSHQILIRKQRDRAMTKLVWKAAGGDERFLMKDINCEYEYQQLVKMRARAEQERRQDAATKIQRWYKTKRSNGLFKIIREIRKTSATKIQRYWRKKLPGILHFKRYISGVNQAAATVQKYLRGFLVGKHSLKVRRNIKLKCLEAYFGEKRREMQLDSQIKIRYFYMRYKARKLRERQEEQMRIYEEERLQQLERDRQQIELFRRQERVGSEVPQGIAEIVMMQGDINILNVQHTFRSTQIANASQVGPSTFIKSQISQSNKGEEQRNEEQSYQEAQSGRDDQEQLML
ncbi:hypothetical protein FGO68_gene9339 [Halteria grandinella]|uniref:Uncharacterized protein n=1 Tax=Halteria grandinella TaxID=5974 RepID=A0A8J8T3N6_HALGN|nr:hypothetical protein FGO68_gene9339 [Halteria grandinella]